MPTDDKISVDLIPFPLKLTYSKPMVNLYIIVNWMESCLNDVGTHTTSTYFYSPNIETKTQSLIDHEKGVGQSHLNGNNVSHVSILI